MKLNLPQFEFNISLGRTSIISSNILVGITSDIFSSYFLTKFFTHYPLTVQSGLKGAYFTLLDVITLLIFRDV